MEYDPISFKQACVKKWQGPFDLDKRLKHFDNFFVEWFNQIPQSYKSIVLTLLSHLDYYSRETVNEWLVKLHSELLSNKSITDENTIFAFIKSNDGKSNSSNDYWTEYKSINEINLELCYENMDAISSEQWEYIDNIVFIDDFSGSGKSFITELKRHIERYTHKNVFFIAINMMKFGQEKIRTFASTNDINIVMLVADVQAKAFESGFFEDDAYAKEQIVEMSRLFNIPREHTLGFEKSQSLVTFYNNTPNNTLGFIRYDTDSYQSIFPRRNSKKPSWQKLKRDKELRKNANYQNQVGVTVGK